MFPRWTKRGPAMPIFHAIAGQIGQLPMIHASRVAELSGLVDAIVGTMNNLETMDLDEISRSDAALIATILLQDLQDAVELGKGTADALTRYAQHAATN